MIDDDKFQMSLKRLEERYVIDDATGLYQTMSEETWA